MSWESPPFSLPPFSGYWHNLYTIKVFWKLKKKKKAIKLNTEQDGCAIYFNMPFVSTQGFPSEKKESTK